MALNRWGEPMPLRLGGLQGEAWAAIMAANEWFDGEDGIAYSAQQTFLRRWSANSPATVTVYNYRTGKQTKQAFDHYRDACRYMVDANARDTQQAYIS